MSPCDGLLLTIPSAGRLASYAFEKNTDSSFRGRVAANGGQFEPSGTAVGWFPCTSRLLRSAPTDRFLKSSVGALRRHLSQYSSMDGHTLLSRPAAANCAGGSQHAHGGRRRSRTRGCQQQVHRSSLLEGGKTAMNYGTFAQRRPA